MKVCIIRNAESRTNAAISRILDALLSSNRKCVLLTRSRFNEKKGVIKKTHNHENHNIDNYEINIKSETGKGIKNIFQLFKYQFTVFKWLIRNKEKFDIIHSFDLDSGLPVFIASKIIKKKYVYHIADFYVDSRGGIPTFFKKILRRQEYKVISNAVATIVCTEERKEQIKGSTPKKLVVIHNAPSITINIQDEKCDINNTDGYGDNEITFAYVGGLVETRFIKTSIDVAKQFDSIRLELAGMGALKDYAYEASKKYDNINYHGMIDYEEALKLYSKCDIMFAIYDPKVPNHKYSAPNKVYEAMMLGKPIIVAKGTGVDKIVINEKMGIVIDYTENNFKEAIDYIRNNSSNIEEMGNNAKKAYELYSWNTMKKRLVNLYDEINE